MKKVFYLGLIIWLSSCASYSDQIEDVLRQAGKNRKELEKVLQHYGKNPTDSLKLRAAEFLIVNMPGKYSVYYDAPWNDVATVMLRWTSSSNKQLVLDTYRLGEKVGEYDVTHIKGDFLISNIDLAFQVWEEMPWGKDIPFDVFCEEILPYRVDNEPLENWRKKVLAIFADLYYVLRDTTMTTVEACSMVNDHLPRFLLDKDFPPMSFSQIMASTRGTCAHMTALAAFVMRGLGIPVTVDYSLLQYGFPTGHSWSSVRDNNGSYRDFMSTEANPGGQHMGKDIYKAKVYRRMFANQQHVISDIANIPPLLRHINHMVDVTSQYAPCMDITIPVRTHALNPAGYVFLAIYHRKQWVPIGWGAVDGDSMRFQSVQSGLYMPVYYHNGVHSPAGFPFYLDSKDSLHLLNPDTVNHTVVLTGIAEINQFIGFRMMNGVFEVANRSDFSDARTIHTIQKLPEPYYHVVSVRPSFSSRYVRFATPAGSRCAVSILEFYDDNDEKLSGTAIGTPGINDTSIDNVFDGQVETSFFTDTVRSWVGLDFGEPRRISKIRYLSLVDGNGIYEGHEYELLYWNGDRWQSLGRKTAESHVLQYDVPAHALLLMENTTKEDNHAKPFYMQDGIQKWIRYD